MADKLDTSNLVLTETVAPGDAAGVAEVVRCAAERGGAVYPIGGGTRLGRGARGERAGVGLSTKRLDRVVDHAARDLTVTVQAGMTVARLQKTLQSARQRLPVDVARPEQATVGGLVAAGADGPRRFRWGTIRDYVLGLRAVDGRGAEFAAGGRVVKNAAGYNVCRLMTGSHGTLGVITQVTLMVRPFARHEAWIGCDLPDFNAAERLLADLVHTPTLPTAAEWLVGPGWDGEPALADVAPGTAGRLLVAFEGSETEVGWMVDTLMAAWKQTNVGTPVAVADTRAKPLAQWLTNASAGDSDEKSPCVAARISVLPGAVTRTVEQLLQLAGDATIQVHAGDGIIIARVPVEPRGAARLVGDRLRPLVVQAGGTMAVLDVPHQAQLDRAAIWGPTPAGFDVMRRIKQQFDPDNILNPGRFIFE